MSSDSQAFFYMPFGELPQRNKHAKPPCKNMPLNQKTLET